MNTAEYTETEKMLLELPRIPFIRGFNIESDLHTI